MEVELKKRLVAVKSSGNLSKLAKEAGLRYQTIYNLIRRNGQMLASTHKRIVDALDKIEDKPKEGGEK